MLRDSKLTNVSLEHRGESQKNSSLSFGKIWQMSKAKWCNFFKLRGRVGAEQELQVLIVTTALQFCSHPGRQESWVKRWANSLMSNITIARMSVSSGKYTNTCASLSKSFSCFSCMFIISYRKACQSLSDHPSSKTSQNTDFLESPEEKVAACLWVYWQHQL